MDESALLFLNGLRAPWLDAIMDPLSSYGFYAFPILMLLALASKARRAAARSIMDGWLAWFVAAFLADTVLKPIFGRPRPTAYEHLRGAIDVLGRAPPASSLAFPSGTAAAVFAGAAFIWLRWGPKPGVPATALAIVVSISRIYAGVHWPTDILGGAVLGVLIAIAVDRTARAAER